ESIEQTHFSSPFRKHTPPSFHPLRCLRSVRLLGKLDRFDPDVHLLDEQSGHRLHRILPLFLYRFPHVRQIGTELDENGDLDRQPLFELHANSLARIFPAEKLADIVNDTATHAGDTVHLDHSQPRDNLNHFRSNLDLTQIRRLILVTHFRSFAPHRDWWFPGIECAHPLPQTEGGLIPSGERESSS